MTRPADSPSRRFHWRGRDKVTLRRWEKDVWRLLFHQNRELRLWSAVLCDGLRRLYHSRSQKILREELAWILAKGNGNLGDFENLCTALGLDAQPIRDDVLTDVRSGKTAVKLEGL